MKRILLIVFVVFSGVLFTKAQLSILLVNDNGYTPDRIEVIKTAITDAGYNYAYWDAPAQSAGPSYEFMKVFDLVIWYTGNDGAGLYFWNGDETENQAIMDYIDNGGMFWVQGLDFLYDKYSGTPVTFLPGEFVYDYLGIEVYQAQSHIDDGTWSDGVPQLDLVAGNGIFTLDPVLWTYEAMWYVDALLPVSGATALYQMGPPGYDLSDYYSAIYYEKGEGKVLSFTFETARLDTQENTDFLFGEALQYFEQFAGTLIPVQDISVTSEGGLTSINENNGTLQFYAEVLPDSASIPFVHWSLVSDGVLAFIDQNGLLRASGTNNGNGTVWVKAEAIDGSGVADSVQVEISNQGGVFNVLLVNDNSHGLDRYLVIDTTLANLELEYDVYNTVETGTFPDLIMLSGYSLVIWYTGNDGVDLKLWDVSDTANGLNENLRFNEPLMQYLDNGGMVWLQGLDWIYDVYSLAPDYFEPGSFMYDKLGIKTYKAQTHENNLGPGLPQLDVVQGNPLTIFTPVKWIYAEGLYYADALEITDDAEAIYKMGPPTFVLSDYYSGVYKETGNWKIFSLTVETARIDTRAHTDVFFEKVINSFKEIWQSVDEYQGADFTLFQNSPNPVKNNTVISYELQNRSTVEITIYDITGRRVYFSNQGEQTPGKHSVNINVDKLGLKNGFYTYSVKVNDNIVSSKMIISK